MTATTLPELCPRVVGGAGARVITCGETLPCRYHGDPIVRIVGPTSAGGGRRG